MTCQDQTTYILLRDHLGNSFMISMKVTKSTIEIFKTLVSGGDPEYLGLWLMKIPLIA